MSEIGHSPENTAQSRINAIKLKLSSYTNSWKSNPGINNETTKLQSQEHSGNPNKYVAAFWKDKGGGFFAGKDAFNADKIDENSASYNVFPQLSDAVWVQQNVQIEGEQEPVPTIMGYSMKNDLGFIFSDLRSVPDGDHMKMKPKPEQYDALRTYKERVQNDSNYRESLPHELKALAEVTQ